MGELSQIKLENEDQYFQQIKRLKTPKSKNEIQAVYLKNNQLKLKNRKLNKIVNNYTTKAQKRVNKIRKLMDRQLQKIEFDLKIIKKQINKKKVAQVPPKSLSSSESQVSVKTSHIGVTCDDCQVQPIVGKRFKCLVCPNFDLCEKCEAKAIHGHPMARLVQNTQNQSLKQICQDFTKDSFEGKMEIEEEKKEREEEKQE